MNEPTHIFMPQRIHDSLAESMGIPEGFRPVVQEQPLHELHGCHHVVMRP